MDSAVFAMATNRFDLTPSTSIYNASQSKKEICDMCAPVLVSRAALDEPSSSLRPSSSTGIDAVVVALKPGGGLYIRGGSRRTHP